MALLILVAVCWSLTSGPEEGMAAGSTSVDVATDGGVDRGCEVGVGLRAGPKAVAAALASALADSDTLVSIPSKFCILHHNMVQGFHPYPDQVVWKDKTSDTASLYRAVGTALQDTPLPATPKIPLGLPSWQQQHDNRHAGMHLNL